MMKFLVKYEIHAKVISVEETELTKVKDIITESFNIEDDIIIQRFDKTWEEFIDINCNEELEDCDKLKIQILPGTQVSNTENPTLHKNLSAPKESDITIASANLQIDEISDSVIVQSTWPKIFTICSENFSKRLIEMLTKETMLDWNCKHEFLNHITEQITVYTYYPSCHQVYDVAKAIIQKFPYLCEKIGSGYDGWYICIKDKLKNVRRKSDEPSVTCRKKLKMSDKTLTSVARKRSFPKGCNWAPSCSDEVDSNSCLEQMDKIMGNPQGFQSGPVPGTFTRLRSCIVPAEITEPPKISGGENHKYDGR